MAAGRTKFVQASDGRIVSKATGRAAPSNYFVIGNTVYKPANNSVGRLKVGTISKLSNAPKKTQAKVEGQARKRRTRGWLYMHGKPQPRPRRTKPIPPREAPAPPPEARQEAADHGLLPIDQQSQINFNKLVDKFIAEGKIDPEVGEAMKARYDVLDDDGRDELWNDLYEMVPAEKSRYHRGESMIDLGVALLPYWDPEQETGGYKWAAVYDPQEDRHDIIGPTNKRTWEGPFRKEARSHNIQFQMDVLDWFENQTGPGSQPESRRVICWDCTTLVTLMLQPMLRRGYLQTESWTPKKGEFFLLDDGETVHSMVFRSRKKGGVEIRIISLKAFVRGHNGLPDIVAKTLPDRTPLGDIPVEPWGIPTDGGLSAILDHSRTLCIIWHRCFESGYIYESSGRQISAGGIAWQNFSKEVWAVGRERPWQVLYPGFGPDLVSKARDLMEDELRQGMRGQISYARPGTYSGVYGYDLNSAYGAALDDWIPYGPLMKVPPKDDPCRGIVYPEGYFVLRRGRIPVISWSSSHDAQRYAWERTYRVHEKVFDFFLDGSMPFYQEEWEILLQFYEPVGAYRIPKVWYISIMKWGLLGERMKRLYQMERRYPQDKLFNKMQIVALYGKLSQHQESENVYYDIKNGWPHRRVRTVPMQSQHLGLGMWVTCWCRIRIMKQLLRMFSKGLRPEDVLYIDTDSVYIARQMDGLFDIDPETPGKWKPEARDADMIILAAKNYQIRKPDGSVKTTSSSLPAEIKRPMRWGDLQEGVSYDYYAFERDPVTWVKSPRPHKFAAAATFLEADDQAYVMPEEIERANGEYT